MKSILDALNKDASFSAETLKQLQDKIRVKTYKKGMILQRQGDVANYCYFVKSGLLRSFIIDQKGKDHVFMFAPEGWIMADMVSQTSGLPSDLFIDVLEDTELEVFNRDLLENIFSKDPKLSKHGRLLLGNRTAVLQKRVIMLMSATASARYQHF